MATLTELANRYGSDKGTQVGLAGGPPHGYTLVYDRLFADSAARDVRLLEIGIFRGASLRMWYEYFPRGSICAVDYRDASHLSDDRITIFRADQENRAQMQRVVACSGGRFDIVIDDGGHRMSQQQISLGCLSPSVNASGLYIIEDLFTSHDAAFGADADGSNTTLTMIQAFQSGRGFHSQYLTKDEIDYFHAHVRDVTLHCDDKLAVFRKR